jgi:hypothetical protein
MNAGYVCMYVGIYTYKKNRARSMHVCKKKTRVCMNAGYVCMHVGIYTYKNKTALEVCMYVKKKPHAKVTVSIGM